MNTSEPVPTPVLLPAPAPRPRASSDFLAGYVAGLCSTTVGFPLDSIKTVMQVSQQSFVSATREIVQSRGVLGLYRGLMSPLASAPLSMALNIGMFGSAARRYRRMLEERGVPSTPMVTHLTAGAGGATAGFVQSFVSLPFEVVKVRMQMQFTKPVSTWQYARTLYASHGVSGFFPRTAIGANLYVIAAGSGFYFFTYSWLTAAAKTHSGRDTLTFGELLLVGGTTGVLFWFTIFSADLIRARLIYDAAAATPQYRGMRHAARSLVAAYGMRALTRGLVPALVRSFFTNSIFMTVHHYLSAT